MSSLHRALLSYLSSGIPWRENVCRVQRDCYVRRKRRLVCKLCLRQQIQAMSSLFFLGRAHSRLWSHAMPLWKRFLLQVWRHLRKLWVQQTSTGGAPTFNVTKNRTQTISPKTSWGNQKKKLRSQKGTNVTWVITAKSRRCSSARNESENAWAIKDNGDPYQIKA